MSIKPLKETTFLEAIAAAIQHEKDYFEFYMNTYEKLPPGRTRELFEKLAEEVDEHIKFIQEIYEISEGEELPNLKQLAAIHKFHQSTIQKIMNKVERTIMTGSRDAHEALELAIREAENAVAFYEKLSTKFDDPNIKSLFIKLMEYNNNYQSLLEAELNSFDQNSSGRGAFFWDEQAEEVAKAVEAPSKTKTTKALKPAKAKKPAAKKAAKKPAAKKAKPVAKKKPAAKKAVPKKKAAAKKKR